MYFSNNRSAEYLLKILYVFGSAPYIKQSTFQLVKSKTSSIVFTFFTFLCAISAFCKLAGVIYILQFENSNVIIPSLAFTAKFLALITFRICQSSREKNKDVVYLMNQMRNQEIVLLDNKGKRSTYFDAAFFLPGLCLPLGFLVTFVKLLRNPCNPPYLGYFVCQFLNTNTTTSLTWTLVKLTTTINALFFALTYMLVMASATLGLYIELLLGVKSICETIKSLSLEDSDHLSGRNARTKIRQKTTLYRLKAYRNVLIITKIYNHCFQSSTYLCALLIGFLIIVSNGIMLIRLQFNQSGSFVIHLFLGSTATYAGVSYLLRISSQVFSLSLSVFQRDSTRDPLLRKLMVSSQTMKIKMGATNYVDKLTCLVFGSNVVETIISYALVSK